MSEADEGAARPPLFWLPWLALGLIAALAWTVLVLGERSMAGMGSGDMGSMASPEMRPQGLLTAWMHAAMKPEAFGPYYAATAAMWIIMMVAMMVPAVLPMVRAVERIARDGDHDGGQPGVFAAGYLIAWSGFGLGAAALQWALHQSGGLHGATLAAGPALAGALLVAAGLYQLTPLKDACLSHCRSPISFVLNHWRPGSLGALRMGLHHGLFCIGCCWVLMLLMFAGGAMSVLWMAVLCALILAERLLPEGPWVARGPAVILLAAGVGLWIHAGLG